MNSTIILELLSAGVIAALITGIFSLTIAIKNNKRLIELENIKQKFTINQERYKELRKSYKELLSLLPEEKLLGHTIVNSPSKKGFQENSLSEFYEIAENNMKIIYTHFQKYSYLFSENEQKGIIDLVEEIDSITKVIINLSNEINIYNTDEDKSAEKFHDTLHTNIIKRITKVTEIETMYYDLYKKNLSKISNSNNNN